jgi:hypothetical protein
MVINIFFTIVMFKVIKCEMHVFCALIVPSPCLLHTKCGSLKKRKNVTRDSALKENETRKPEVGQPAFCLTYFQ